MRIELESVRRVKKKRFNSESGRFENAFDGQGDYQQRVYVWDGANYHLWGKIRIYTRWTVNKDISNALPDFYNRTLDEIHKVSEDVKNDTLIRRIQTYEVGLDDDYTTTGDPVFARFEVRGWWSVGNDGIYSMIDIPSDHPAAKAARTAMIEWIHEQFDPRL